MEQLHKTLNQMRDVFSSNEFARKARKNGITEYEIHKGIVATFLHTNAERRGSKRMWKKKNGNISNNSEQEAIKLLKSKGYKIIKIQLVETEI